VSNTVKIRILFVDDDAMTRLLLRTVLARSLPNAVIFEAAHLQEALSISEREELDLAIVDLSLRGESGLEVIRQTRMLKHSLPILVLSSRLEEESAVACALAGAQGFLNKSTAVNSAHLNEAITKLLNGQQYFSPEIESVLANSEALPSSETSRLSDQERRVLYLIASGNSVKEAAGLMHISEKTVRTYRARLLSKLQLRSDTEIVRYALQSGILEK